MPLRQEALEQSLAAERAACAALRAEVADAKVEWGAWQARCSALEKANERMSTELRRYQQFDRSTAELRQPYASPPPPPPSPATRPPSPVFFDEEQREAAAAADEAGAYWSEVNDLRREQFDDFVGTVVRRAVPAKARALAADVAASDVVAAVAARLAAVVHEVLRLARCVGPACADLYDALRTKERAEIVASGREAAQAAAARGRRWIDGRAAAVEAWAQSEPVTEARDVLRVCAVGLWLWLVDVAAAVKGSRAGLAVQGWAARAWAMSKPATLKTWKATKAWADTDVDADYMWLSDRAAAVKAWAQSEPVTEARAVLTVCATGVWLWLLDVAAAAKAWAQSEPVTEAREVLRVCAVGLWLWLTDSLSALRAAATSEETAEYWAEVNALRKRQLDGAVSAVLDGAAATRARALAKQGRQRLAPALRDALLAADVRRRQLLASTAARAPRCAPAAPRSPPTRARRSARPRRPRGPRRPSPPSAWRRRRSRRANGSRRGARRRRPRRRRRRATSSACARWGCGCGWPRRSAR